MLVFPEMDSLTILYPGSRGFFLTSHVVGLFMPQTYTNQLHD